MDTTSEICVDINTIKGQGDPAYQPTPDDILNGARRLILSGEYVYSNPTYTPRGYPGSGKISPSQSIPDKVYLAEAVVAGYSSLEQGKPVWGIAIECATFVHLSMLQAGYNIRRFNTSDFETNRATSKEGDYNEIKNTKLAQPGDVFLKKHHVGIVSEITKDDQNNAINITILEAPETSSELREREFTDIEIKAFNNPSAINGLNYRIFRVKPERALPIPEDANPEEKRKNAIFQWKAMDNKRLKDIHNYLKRQSPQGDEKPSFEPEMPRNSREALHLLRHNLRHTPPNSDQLNVPHDSTLEDPRFSGQRNRTNTARLPLTYVNPITRERFSPTESLNSQKKSFQTPNKKHELSVLLPSFSQKRRVIKRSIEDSPQTVGSPHAVALGAPAPLAGREHDFNLNATAAIAAPHPVLLAAAVAGGASPVEARAALDLFAREQPDLLTQFVAIANYRPEEVQPEHIAPLLDYAAARLAPQETAPALVAPALAPAPAPEVENGETAAGWGRLEIRQLPPRTPVVAGDAPTPVDAGMSRDGDLAARVAALEAIIAALPGQWRAEMTQALPGPARPSSVMDYSQLRDALPSGQMRNLYNKLDPHGTF